MVNIGLFYPRLVKRFIANLPKGFDNDVRNEYIKFHVLGNYIVFCPTIINDYLGNGKIINVDRITLLKIIA